MRSLPGISIVDVPSAPADALPPMDVPVFVGFAERGPLDRPVALADPAQYEAVFGGALELVPAGGGAPALYAHLPAAVASFFAGGGRRCYVIRVAGKGAATARFAVQGLRLATRARVPGAGAGPWSLEDEDLTLQANSPGVWADLYQLALRRSGRALRRGDPVHAGEVLRARARPASPPSPPSPPAPNAPAGWLRVGSGGPVEAVLGAAAADDWLWQDAAGHQAPGVAIPELEHWLIDAVTVDLALRHPLRPALRRDGCALAAGGGDLPWFEPGVQARFDAGAGDGGEGSLASIAWPLASAEARPDASVPDWMLVPALVGTAFGEWRSAQVGDGDALARMGLADYTAALFCDGAWSELAAPRGAQLLRWADDIRFLSAGARRLRGLHGALGQDDAVARDATWIAVPDAAHPGWVELEPPPRADGLLVPTPDPDCGGAGATPFSGCVKPPRPPQPPQFKLAALAPADAEWFIDALAPAAPAPDAALAYEVQLARMPDFSDAAPLPASGASPGPRADAPARYALRLRAGLVFLRARAWRAGLPSAWSATAEVHVVAGTRAARPGPESDAVLFPVHAALIDLCAATREHFALLAAPRSWDEARLAAHVRRLRARAATGAEALQDASFAAIHHPWLLRREDGASAARPPEGALLGVYARRSRTRGAWSPAGLDPLPEAVGLATQADPGALEEAGANAIELRPRGVAATRAATLSDDPDWSAIGVRRLFILLRRLARGEGQRYAFEPNDMTLRRSLERSFDALLQRLMQSGAFRGSRAPDCYLLRTASGSQAQAEIERGECNLAIQVAPSRPLRFLTLRVVRAGERLSIEES